MKLSQERQGEISIFFEAILWSLFPVVTVLSFSALSPMLALSGSTFFASMFFALIISVRKKWAQIKNTEALKDILWSTFFIGILFYTFFFFGLKYTSAGNAGIIALSEIFFSYLFFQVWHKEQMPIAHKIGAIFMLLGAIVVLYPNFTTFHPGDLLILSAAIVAPFGNWFARRARKRVSGEVIMFVRSAVTTPVIFLLAVLFGEAFTPSAFSSSVWFLIINGFFLLGLSKIFWIEGIHRISVTKANALTSIAPLLTLFFAWLLLNNTPTLWQLCALLPICIGTLLLRMNTQP